MSWREKQTKLRLPSLKKPLQFFEKYKFLLLIAGVGLLLLLLPTGGGRAAEPTEQQSHAVSFSLSGEEAKLEQVLSQVAGAGRVQVLLTLRDGGQKDYLQNESRSGQTGGDGAMEHEEEQETVVVARGSGYQETVVTKQWYPAYQGALVVCDGGGDAAVCLALTRAVSALTGLGTDKISILKMGAD